MGESLSDANIAALDLKIEAIDYKDEGALTTFLDLAEEYYREEWPQEAAQNNWRERFRGLLIERCKTDPMRWLWLVRHESKLVGLAIFYVTGPEDARLATIGDLYVRGNYRHRHVGSLLLEKIRNEVANYKATRLKATVGVDELGRVKFLENNGFSVERLNMVLDLDNPTGDNDIDA